MRHRRTATPGALFTVLVTDDCSACNAEQINIQYDAFQALLAPGSDGQLNISWRQARSSAACNGEQTTQQIGQRSSPLTYKTGVRGGWGKTPALRLSMQPMLSAPCNRMQVECQPGGNIVANVDTYRADAGGYIRLTLQQARLLGLLLLLDPI